MHYHNPLRLPVTSTMDVGVRAMQYLLPLVLLAPSSAFGATHAPSSLYSGFVRTDLYIGCGSLAPRDEPDIRTFPNPRITSDSLVRSDAACGDVECGPIKDEFGGQ